MSKLSRIRRFGIPVLVMAVVSILFTACLKNKNDNDIPAAGVLAFNLAPDQQSVVIALSGNSITYSPLAYTNYNGNYQRVYTGNRKVESFDYPDNTPLASTSANFEQDKYYSVFVLGIDNKYRNVVATDNFDSLSANSGNAYVRFINAITDSVNASTVTIAAGGNNVVNVSAPYSTVSEFTAIAPGEISVAVKNATGVDASRNITVEQKKAYTILLTGVPGATDDARKVQVKYILNGTLTGETGK